MSFVYPSFLWAFLLLSIPILLHFFHFQRKKTLYFSSLRFLKNLEKEIDFSSGLKLNGALSIATTKGRWQELLRQATTAQLFNVNVEILNIKQIK